MIKFDKLSVFYGNISVIGSEICLEFTKFEKYAKHTLYNFALSKNSGYWEVYERATSSNSLILMYWFYKILMHARMQPVCDNNQRIRCKKEKSCKKSSHFNSRYTKLDYISFDNCFEILSRWKRLNIKRKYLDRTIDEWHTFYPKDLPELCWHDGNFETQRNYNFV